MTIRTFEIANIVITFGTEGLVANFEERVWPAISNASIKGRGEVHGYKFINLKLQFIEFENVKYPVLSGRLVKRMTIEAEQRLDDSDQIQPNLDRMPSDPSSFFVIELTQHKISFLKEAKRAPTLQDLEYCFRKALTFEYWKQYQVLKKEFLVENQIKRLSPKKKDEFTESISNFLIPPDVRITPIPSVGDIDARIAKFNLIETISINPLKTNNELADENAAFLRHLQGQSDKLNSKSAKIELKNSKEGLNKEESAELIKKASDGNFKVKLSGVTNNGQRITGDDLEEYGLKIREDVPIRESFNERATRVFTKLKRAMLDGLITLSTSTDNVEQKAKELVEKLNSEDERE